MKIKILSIILFIFLPFMVAEGQVVIEMEDDGGVYKIPCIVNGAKMKLVFDTGAAMVCISESIAEYLLDNDYLSKNDIVGIGNSTVADGRIVNNIHIILRDIEIAGYHIEDVDAIVIQGQKAPLLLGQSAIQKLGKISIQGNKLIIESASNEIDYARIAALHEQGNRLFSQQDYHSAIPPLAEVHRTIGLNEAGLAELIRCYSKMEQYDKVLSLYQEWIDDYETEAYWVTNDIVYDDTSNAFYYSNNYNAAISVSNKRLDNLKKWDEKIEDDEERKDWLFSYTMANAMLGYCHMKQDRTSLAENDFINAAVAYRFYLDVDAEDVNLGKVKDPLLGSFYYAMAANHTYLSSSYIVLMCTACKCGYEPAIELLRSTGRYNEYMSLFESTVIGK